MVFFTLLAVCLLHSNLIIASPFVGYSSPVAAVAYHQPALATIGAVVKTIPTSVSHASHAVVHKSDHVVHDVVAPVLKSTYTVPVSYATYAAAPIRYNPYI